MAISLELPKKFAMNIDQARQAALEVFRPISRKYDLAEHAYPVELDTLAALYDGLSAAGQAGAGGQGRGQRRPQRPLVIRLEAGLQHQQQIPRLLLGKDALAVRKIDRGDTQAG